MVMIAWCAITLTHGFSCTLLFQILLLAYFLVMVHWVFMFTNGWTIACIQYALSGCIFDILEV